MKTQKRNQADEFLQKMKEKWGLDSLFQVILIMIVFSLAGMSVLFLRKVFFNLIGFTETTPFWIKTVTYILFIFPAYQLMLMMYGFLLGQFSFFWEKEKKMALWVATKFRKR